MSAHEEHLRNLRSIRATVLTGEERSAMAADMDRAIAAFAAQPAPSNAMVDTARRNLRQFVSKASFASSVDQQAALACVDVLEEALDTATPPAAQDVDLGQFRPFVEAQRAEYISHGLTEEDYCVSECDDLLALIDSKAVDHDPVREPLLVCVPWRDAYPYFECTPEQWSRHTQGMTPAGKNMLANMLAHHCLLAQRDELGWIITRYDLIAEGRPWWHVSNDGKLTYDYDPATKKRKEKVP